MPTVRYHANSFPLHYGTPLTGHHNLTVQWAELVWAAVTMGKPGVALLLTHGWHSVADMVVRSHTIYANLRQSGSYIQKSCLYKDLDPTEKGATSYFMGMVAAKIVGVRLINVPWLFHLSMANSLGVSLQVAGKSAPDLIGLNRVRDWVVVEAKGRTGVFCSKAMNKAKAQTRQLRLINGQSPSLRVAVQAYFEPVMQWNIVDPEDFNEDAEDLDVDMDVLLDRYYSLVISDNLRENIQMLAGRKFQVLELPEIGVTVAVDAEIRERVRVREGGRRGLNVAPDFFAGVSQKDDFTVFPDGLAVSLDSRWSEICMMAEPTKRR